MSELDDILSLLTERVQGVLGAAVSGVDGLVVEQVPADSDGLVAAAAEVSMIVNGPGARLAHALSSKGPLELRLCFTETEVLARQLESELYLLLLLEAGTPVEVARPLIDRAAASLSRVLA